MVKHLHRRLVAPIAAAAGDTLTVYLTGARKGNTVTATDGVSDLSGLLLIRNHVVLHSDNGANPITIADLTRYDKTDNDYCAVFYSP